MNLLKIHKAFVAYRFVLIFTAIIFIALRIPYHNEATYVTLWASTAIQIGVALFLLYLTQTFGFIRQQKTLLPAFFYLLLTGTNPVFFNDLTGSVSALIIVLCLLFLFYSYQDPWSQGYAFNISLLLTLGSFYWFPILIFLPLFWYGMLRFQSLNIKTFSASLVGIVIVYVFIFAWSIHQSDLSILVSLLPDFRTVWEIHLFSFEPKDWIVCGLLFFLCLLAGLRIFMTGISEKVHAMKTLSYLYFFTVVVFALFLIQSQWLKEWLSILYLPISLLAAYYFTLSRQRLAIWLFLLTVLFFLMAYVV